MLMKSKWALRRRPRCLPLGAEVLIAGQMFHFSQRHFSRRAAEEEFRLPFFFLACLIIIHFID